MRAIVVKETGAFELTDMDKPSPRSDEALVRVAVAGLCRTDLKIIEAGHRDLVLPRVPGEEVVGAVCEIGPDTDDSLLGKRVYIYPGTCCGECRACRSGAENLCASMRIMGFHRDGGFTEYVTAPAKSLIEIPAHMSFEDAVFAEPLSCCLNALELAGLKSDETIAIWGGGPAGTLLARAAKATGAKPIVIESDRRRRDLIDGLAMVPDDFFDVAVVAVGSHEALAAGRLPGQAYAEAIEHLGPRGRLVVFSGLAPDKARQSIDLNRLHYHEQTIVGAYGCCYRHGKQALNWISQGRVAVHDVISHRLPLTELGRALDIVRKREGMKILLYPYDGDSSED